MQGWIKLHRKLSDNDLWLSEKFTRGQAWVDLLMLANHKDNFIYVRNMKVAVKRGRIGWSVVALASRWKWSRGKTIRFLRTLENNEQIVQQKNNVTSIITITNYDSYQSVVQQTEQQTVQQTDSRQYTNKNDNNENNVNKKKRRVKKPFSPPTLEEVSSYIKEKELSVDGDFFFKFFTEGNWYDSKGNKVKSWKQKLLTWNNHKDNKADVNIGKTEDFSEQTRAEVAGMKIPKYPSPKQETESDDVPF